MIVDAILRAVYAGADMGPEADAESYEPPLNLERFFARKLPAEPARYRRKRPPRLRWWRLLLARGAALVLRP